MMNTHVNKTSENKSQTVDNSVSKHKSSHVSTSKDANNAQTAIEEGKTANLLYNNPHTQQLKAYQDLANNSIQAKQLRSYQAIATSHTLQVAQRKENNTGLPDRLKAGIENLSGFSMAGTRVHYNSSQPAQLNAHAYAQGNDIHLAPGQEKHLPHEAWHVIQQKQGRVQTTIQMKDGVGINDDKGLEVEADVMGLKALDNDKITLDDHSDFHEPSFSSSTFQLHPLKFDSATYNIEVLDALQEFDKNATLKDLILQKTPKAKEIMQSYVEKRGATGQADFLLLQSILATIELHTSGVWHEAVINENNNAIGAEESQILELMQVAYGQKQQIATHYGLSKEELHAIECYTQPGKNKKEEPWYMGPDLKWNNYENGWKALEIALDKLPSLRDLGLEITTYRTIRTNDSSRKAATGNGLDPTSAVLSKLLPETNILHGKDQIAPFGQRHYMSTGITYTTSHMTNDRTGQGLVAMTGGSGKYIGPLGEARWFHDGGEILYPPQMYSKFEGTAPQGWQQGNMKLPVHHLQEVEHPEPFQGILEDHNFKKLKKRHPHLDNNKSILIKQIEEMSGGDMEKISLARAQSNVHGEINYLNIYELQRLLEYLQPKFDLDNLTHEKMDLIEEFQGVSPSIFAEARLKAGIHDDIAYLSLWELKVLKKRILSLDNS